VTLAESDLADCVGISTVAFTSDKELVLTSQTDRNIASGDLLAPSGSGSLDRHDLGAHNDILQRVVRHAMERELREETGIRPDDIRSTEIIGFARWLDRGAKPEFFGITKLYITAKPQSTGHSGLIPACQNERVPSDLGRWELRSFQDPVREDTL
jgi:8-oxo-dGTP pyrophosphatase MutT (NUDIX family)